MPSVPRAGSVAVKGDCDDSGRLVRHMWECRRVCGEEY